MPVQPLFDVEQAQTVVHAHLGGQNIVTVVAVTELKNSGYSYSPAFKTFIVDLTARKLIGQAMPCSAFLTLDTTDASGNESGAPFKRSTNTLAMIHELIGRIRKHTDIPIPEPKLDTSLSLIPYPFLLSPAAPITSPDIISLSAARKAGLLTTEANLLVNLQIGRFLGQMHSGVQNDEFGLPGGPPNDASYSWQETFTSLIEGLLSDFEESGEWKDLPYPTIRQYLSRAIGSFLFDDVEVPSLIWFTGSEDDIYVFAPTSSIAGNGAGNGGLAAILPNLGHAVWGDPLMESFFLPPGPPDAILEGYTASGGAPLIVFPRQKTKRLWYTLFLALKVLKERKGGPASVGGGDPSATAINRTWALDIIAKTVDALKDAPCY